ncbi:MAG: hypothetical protein ACYCXW_06930 [Solirubrobacteraceae bacterium]
MLYSVVSWIVALDLVAVAGSRLLAPQPELGRTALTAAWQQWDANWYARIVAVGYHALGAHVARHGAIYLQTAFYPGYPVIARAVFDIAHPLGIGIGGAMLLTNQTLVLVMAYLVYRMALALTHNAAIAVRTVHYLLLFPFAYFLLAPYSETAFLTVVAGFVWALVARRYFVASCFAAAASGTRLVGVVLALILVVGYLEHHCWNLRSIGPRIVGSAVVACAGAAGYAAYQWVAFDNPVYSQRASFLGWERHFSLNVSHFIYESFTHPYLSAGTLDGLSIETYVVLPLIAAFCMLTFFVWRKFGAALGLMCALLIVVPLASGSALSFPRYTLPLLPCFVVLASWGRNAALAVPYRTISGALLVLYLVMFTHGIWTG